MDSDTYLWEWLNPIRRVRRSGFWTLWKRKEESALLVSARVFFLLVAGSYLAHIPLVDRPLQLEPREIWLTYRIGLAGLCLMAFATTFVTAARNIVVLQTVMGFVGLVISFFQSRSMLWSPEVPYFYSFLIPSIVTLLLRLSASLSAVYLILALLLQWPNLVAADVSWMVLSSASIVAITTVTLLRSRLTFEIDAFLAERHLEQAKRELETAHEDLKELDRAKTRFFANVSHELRTPLMLIMAPVQRLLQTSQNLEQEELLRVVESNAHRLLRQVAMFLDLARGEAGHLRLELGEHDAGEIVSGVVQAARPFAEQRGVTIELHGAESMGVASLDRDKLEIIVGNLVSNAIKFTPAGGRIDVRCEGDPREVRVSVSDTGVGIPKAELESVFERFHQVPSEFAPQHEGTGLGLAITRELVRLHGGDVRSLEVDTGATFEFCIPRHAEGTFDRRQVPRRRADKLAAARVDALVAKHTGPNRPPVEVMFGNMGRPHLRESPQLGPEGAPLVLVVEDNADLRNLIVHELSQKYRVIQAPDGQRGAELAIERKPDVILSDITMPQVDGFDLLRRVRSTNGLSATPVLLLTSRSGTDAVVQGLEAGADGYITKPFDLRELSARVDAVIRHESLRQELTERDTRLAALGQLVSQLVHDLRNPLTVIMAMEGMLRANVGRLSRRGEVGSLHEVSEIADNLNVLSQQSERLKGMLEDILLYARGSNPRAQHLNTSVAGLLRQAAGDARMVLAQSGVTLQLDLEAIGDVTVPADRMQLQRAMANILDNAWEACLAAQKASPGRGIRIRISARLDEDHEQVRITIEDDGLGVPEAQRSRIFDAFVTDGKRAGTGLGLATVRNVIIAHAGRVHVDESADLGGARFVIELPLRAETPAPASASP